MFGRAQRALGAISVASLFPTPAMAEIPCRDMPLAQAHTELLEELAFMDLPSLWTGWRSPLQVQFLRDQPLRSLSLTA